MVSAKIKFAPDVVISVCLQIGSGTVKDLTCRRLAADRGHSHPLLVVADTGQRWEFSRCERPTCTARGGISIAFPWGSFASFVSAVSGTVGPPKAAIVHLVIPTRYRIDQSKLDDMTRRVMAYSKHMNLRT